jgi:hypothetical protein
MKAAAMPDCRPARVGCAIALGASMLLALGADDPKPGSSECPLRYAGPALPSSQLPDGGALYSPGVQNIQVYRANRRASTSFRTLQSAGYTYNHHQDIACWKGKLYVAWVMGLKDEDIPPSQVMYASSSDGFNWSEPRNLFPPEMGWQLRFYFYRASGDRMLVFACGPFQFKDRLSEKDKRTLLVREFKADDQLGPVYTLVNPGPAYPPSFDQSPDKEFVAACREALACRLLLEQQDYGVFLGDRRMKWHDPASWPGGKVQGRDDYWTFGKAFCFYHRRDGTLIGLCKLGFVTQSSDEGETWSLPVVGKGLERLGGAKEWAQRTPDGRYAMVYPPSTSGNRFPMVVTTSDDGITFSNMRLVHADVPPQRYEGKYKDMGPQYLRGVAEWAGDAPTIDNSAIWVVYSVSKEDIWVSRIPVPIASETKQPVRDNFEDWKPGRRVPGWNTYSSQWAPVSVARKADGGNQCLELKDAEPVDYARAVRTFPTSSSTTISFRLMAAQSDRGRLEIDLLGETGTRPVQFVLSDKGRLLAGGPAGLSDLGAYTEGQWTKFTIQVADGRFSLTRDGKRVLNDCEFCEKSPWVYAISFRTGEYRKTVPGQAKADLSARDEPLAASLYLVDDLVAAGQKPRE